MKEYISNVYINKIFYQVLFYQNSSFSKNVPKFWLKKSYNILKIPFNMLIELEESIEFYQLHWEIPQLSPG